MAQNKGALTVRNVVVCEDVRREDNGKEFLIGVYSGPIFTNAMPCTLVLTHWISLEASAPGACKLECKIINTDESIIHPVPPIKLSIPGDIGSVSLGVGAAINVSKSGAMTFHVRQNDGEWIEASRKIIDHMSATPKELITISNA
jgi:hypothetical protein